ncbi:SDR family NAD(P)-dependent oxidoreductase [Haladaptatus sp.]|uniref:SDR family NAD(P)-dependent oxidoreductase n=1 Tax=Haladaptatus sp. TaxID=1973141 RepID=UPI003C380EDA
MVNTLDGKTAVVTGSSSGIGNAIAREFASRGVNVVVNSRSEERAAEAAEVIADETDAEAESLLAIEADVTDGDSLESLVERTVEEFGSLDVWVNNAGINIRGPAEEMAMEDWQKVIDVNLTAPFRGAQLAGRQMIEQGTGGAIINISSMMGEQGQTGRTPYNTSKGGVNNLTRCLAVEWAEHDILVNAISPGYIRTEMVGDAQDQIGFDEDDVIDRTPVGRFGTPEEVANCAAFLAEGEHFMTGEILHPDGGWLSFGWGSKS